MNANNLFGFYSSKATPDENKQNETPDKAVNPLKFKQTQDQDLNALLAQLEENSQHEFKVMKQISGMKKGQDVMIDQINKAIAQKGLSGKIAHADSVGFNEKCDKYELAYHKSPSTRGPNHFVRMYYNASGTSDRIAFDKKSSLRGAANNAHKTIFANSEGSDLKIYDAASRKKAITDHSGYLYYIDVYNDFRVCVLVEKFYPLEDVGLTPLISELIGLDIARNIASLQETLENTRAEQIGLNAKATVRASMLGLDLDSLKVEESDDTPIPN